MSALAKPAAPSEAELCAARAGPPGWTDARTALARRLFVDLGWSGAETARAVGGGLSRNAVIGKAYRDGWGGARGGVARLPAPARPAAPSAPRAAAKPEPKAERPALRVVKPEPAAFAPPVPPQDPAMPEATHDDTPAAVLALRYGDCRWPIGDPAKAGFRFCCRPKLAERPYCREHLAAGTVRPFRNATAAQLARSLRRFV